MKTRIGVCVLSVAVLGCISTEAGAFETRECKAFASSAARAKEDKEAGVSFEQYTRRQRQYDDAGRKVANNYTDAGFLVYKDPRFMQLSPGRVYDEAMDYCERRQ